MNSTRFLSPAFKATIALLIVGTCSVPAFADKDDFEVIDSSDVKDRNRSEPLVIQSKTSIHANPTFTDLHSDVVKLIEFSYKYGNAGNTDRENYLNVESIKGWENKGSISATRGFMFKDKNAGLLAYNEAQNTLAIIYHGSQNSGDWTTNLVSHKSLARDYGFENEGQVHTGFADKFNSSVKSLYTNLDVFFDALTPERKNDLKIITAGHSQGGALAQMVTLKICKEYLKKATAYGGSFDNSQANIVSAYFYSAPRVFDAKAAKDYEESVGSHNSIRHNVKHDIVPNSVLGETGHKILSKVSTRVANYFSGYKSVGHLALQNTTETVIKGYKQTFKAIWNDFTAGNSSFDIALKVVSKVLNPLDTIKEILTDVARPLWYAHMSTGGFNPNMVNLNTTTLLQAGLDHQN